MNTLTQEQQILIEQYLLQELTVEQQAIFDVLVRSNAQFAEVVLLEDLMLTALQETALEESLESVTNGSEYSDFCELLLDIDDNFAMQQNIESMLASDHIAPQASGFSTHEAQSFRVVEEYAKALSATQRSDSATIEEIAVFLPPNGIRCKNFQLSFRIQPTDTPLKLRIENNRKQTILRLDIADNTTDFVVQLPQDRCPNGRYYWKLYDRESMIIREFFIWENQ